MEFVLHYRGKLKANGDPVHKHQIRKHFHRQLKVLWSQPPLNEQAVIALNPCAPEHDHPKGPFHVVREFEPFHFAPLVTAHFKTLAELSIVLMRPEPPGSLLTQGGDMDNRLKTLFDALTMPRHKEALKNAVPDADETPVFFCLLEDDNLVSKLSVSTEQLLEPGIDPKEVELTIRVKTRLTSVVNGFLELL